VVNKMRCDYKGCRRAPYCEAYKIGESWSYLCKKHFIQEHKRHGENYGWYLLTIWERITVIFRR